VMKWGGNHPTVITKQGGGLHPDMRFALTIGFLAMTLLAALLLWSRARLALAGSRLAQVEERAAGAGLVHTRKAHHESSRRPEDCQRRPERALDCIYRGRGRRRDDQRRSPARLCLQRDVGDPARVRVHELAQAGRIGPPPRRGRKSALEALDP